ncbi:glycosyltransferase [Marinobacter pelagius]|uniref:glycosyltransferase n=1 Tax=Marinobacter sp. C7 TaxID=2951363 RepID=UPI001EF09AF7|nr:glycosyltransferase [Marinobacter sp. C7]MCG7199474.1 glycosyltransferase [Marinobacter sp. C7]
MRSHGALETASGLAAPLRVLHVASGDLWAGAENSTYHLLRALAHKCSVYAVLLNHGELERQLKAESIPVTVLDEYQRGPFRILRDLRKILQIIRPDVIHTHRQKENILATIANQTTLHQPLIRTVHGLPESGRNLRSEIIRYLDQLFGKYATSGIIAVSEDLKNQLGTTYPPQSIKRIYNGVDAQLLIDRVKKADLRIDLPKGDHVGIIGRLVPVKRIDVFIELARLASAQNTDIHFHIIGDGPERRSLEALAGQKLIQNNLTFHGHRDDIPSCIRALDAIVMCSDHEGMPMVALEALALGTRLLVHDVGGLHELRGQHNVCLIPSNRPELYLNALLAKDDTDKPRQPIQEALTSERQARETLDYYWSFLPNISDSKVDATDNFNDSNYGRKSQE